MDRRIIAAIERHPFVFFFIIIGAIHIIEHFTHTEIFLPLSRWTGIPDYYLHAAVDLLLVYPLVYFFYYKPFNRRYQIYKCQQMSLKEKNRLLKEDAAGKSAIASAEEEKYKTLFDMINDAAYLHPIDRKEGISSNFEQVNEAATKMLGYTREEFLAMGPNDIDSKLSDEEKEEIKNSLSSTDTFRFNRQHIHKDGHLVDVEINAKVFEFNNRPYILAIARDITEQKAKERRLQILSQTVEQSADFITITDIDGTITYINDAHLKILQYTKEEVLGKKPSLFKSGEYSDSYYKGMWNTILKGIPYQSTIKNKCKDGSFYHEEITITPLKDKNGKVTGFVSTGKDITEKVLIQNELNENQQLFQTLTEHAVAGVFLYQDTYIYINPAFCEILGYSAEELMNMHVVDLISPDMREYYHQRNIDRMVGNLGHERIYDEIKYIRKSGEERWMYVATDTIMYKGKITGIGTLVDMTDKKELENELQKHATTDTLTGAYNRRKFDEMIPKEMASAQRFSQPFSLIYFDIDHFKKVNDTYGHDVGDDILVAVVKIIHTTIRTTDTLFRWGGEEFIIFMAQTPLDAARVFAERLRLLVESYPFDVVDTITISMGVSVYHGGEPITDVIERADHALYEAKKNGRNRVVVSE